MPYAPTTPTLDLCNDLITALLDSWNPSSPSGAERKYLERIDVEDVRGRQVFLFPTGYDVGPAARGLRDYTHRITALVAERYTDGGDPPAAWLDERCDFVHTYLVLGFDYSHNGPASFNSNLITLALDVPVLYDVEMLVTKQLFWCAIEMVFEEHRTL